MSAKGSRLTKEHVLGEIRRVAQANGGSPPGVRKFETETGIKEHQVLGVFWRVWSDALREAGFEPNQMETAYSIADLTEKFVELARERGHLPTENDLRLKHRSDTEFPSEKTWRRVGGKRKLVDLALIYCKEKKYEDVLSMCQQYVPRSRDQEPGPTPGGDAQASSTASSRVAAIRLGERMRQGEGSTRLPYSFLKGRAEFTK